MSFSEWVTFSLGSLCEDIFDGPHATPKKTEHGPIFLGISNLVNGRIDLTKTEHLSEEDFMVWTRRVTPQPDDIVFSYETRLGEAALIPKGLRCCLGRRMGLLRCDTTKADPQFMLYAYLGPEFQQTIRERTIHGSTVQRIPLIELPDFPITIPPLPTQRRIAGILSALDEKIELNRQANATLEAMAQAIFKEWFVNFNYPGATGELVESELGLIPAEWYTNKSEELFEVKDGTHDSPKSTIDGYPLITTKHLRDDGQIDFSVANRISEQDFFDICRRSKVDHQDILYSMIGTIGNIALVSEKDVDFAIKNIGLFKTSQRPDFAIFMNYYLRSDFSKSYFRERMSGSTQQYVTLKTLRNLPVLVPDSSSLLSWNSLIAPIIEKIHSNQLQEQLLAQCRDILLPRFMRGEIDV